MSRIYRTGMGVLTINLPVATKNEANSSGWNRFRRQKYRKGVRMIVGLALLSVPRKLFPPLPLTVTLTRHSAGKLDEHDGLPMSQKTVVDAIAEFFKTDDGSGKITWKYAQAKAKRGTCWTECRIERRT